MTAKARVLAYAQLLRLPNVFTAFADICMAGAASGAIVDKTGQWVLVLISSACFYLFGMVTNDVSDRREDGKARPSRPLPSGRVTIRTANYLACALMVGGFLVASRVESLATFPMAFLPSGLVVAIVMYNVWIKHTPIGPIAMGFCRFLNVLLGLSAVPGEVTLELALHLASVVGVYIVGVTWFARTEEGASNRRHLLAAAGVMLFALGLALAVPLHLTPGTSPWYFPFLLVGFGFLIGSPITAAVRRPEPKFVQAAVKRCILGLVVLDAVLATAFVGAPGLLILLLLPPALLLGKWVYST